MKYALFFLCIITLLSCNKDDEMDNQEQDTSNLVIVDYNPKESYTAEEVTIQIEGIDSTATIEVFFSGVKSEIVSINGNNLVARVPSNASSGDLRVKFEGQDNLVGVIEITQETNDFYVMFEDDINETFSTVSFRPYDIGNDMVGNSFFNMTQIGPFISNTDISKSKNLLYFANSVDCGQNGGCFGEGYLYDLSNNKKLETFPIFSDAASFSRTIISTFEDKFFWISRDTNPESRTFNEYNLDTGLVERSVDSIAEGNPAMPLQVFLPETNEIVGFRFGGNKYGRTNLDTFEYVEFTTDDYIRHLNLTSEGKLIGVSVLNKQLVEIDKQNGDVKEVIYEPGFTIISWDYSSTTGRYFILEKCGCGGNPQTKLSIYNPNNGVTTLLSNNLAIGNILTNN